MKESDIQVMVADYLRLQYPYVLFHSDFGSGIKLTIGQATKQKRQNGGRRAWPDMIIAEPVKRNGKQYFGLFLELKKDGANLYKKDGTLKSDEHLQEQANILKQLTKKGYMAEFAVGFDGAKRIIDWYLKGAV